MQSLQKRSEKPGPVGGTTNLQGAAQTQGAGLGRAEAHRTGAAPLPLASPPALPALPEGSSSWAGLATTLLQARQTILPKRLGAPGPDAAELAQIVGAAAHAPDHGQLLPWRLVQVPPDARVPLADAFAAALLARDATASPAQVAQAREKAHRSPVLLLLVVNAVCGDPEVDLNERMVSAGCALQNLLLLATALGYGSALTSGKALKDAGLRRLFGLGEGEHAVCFVNLGTVLSRKPARQRPSSSAYFSVLDAGGANAGAGAGADAGAQTHPGTSAEPQPGTAAHGPLPFLNS